MAKWEQHSIGQNPYLEMIAETAQKGIVSVQTGMEFVKIVGEGAKLVLIAGPETALATFATLVADEVIALLNDYKELGWYALIIDPTNDNYGAKPQGSWGLEMITDENDLIQFKKITVQNLDSPFNGQTFFPNDKYIKSMKLADLKNFEPRSSGGPGQLASSYDDAYRDRRGRTKEEEGFVPPIPALVNPPKFVLGGYDPANWTGEASYTDSFPSLPASKVLQLMSDAFDDEGDIPKYQVINKVEKFTKGPFTEAGATLTRYDPILEYTMPLYRNANTQLATSARGEITTQVQAGKPNYMGNAELEGIKISALVVLIGAADFKEWFDSMKAAADFFGGPLPDLSKIVKALEKLFSPDPIIVTAEVNTQFGKFKEGMYIKGFDSGTVGLIDEIISEEVTEKRRKEYIFKNDEFGDLASIQFRGVDTNQDADGNPIWFDTKFKYTPQNPLNLNFSPTEMICEADKFEKPSSTNPDLKIKTFRIKGIEFKDNILGMNWGKGSFADDSKLPTFGFMRSVEAIAPASVEPDFFSIKAAQIPGYAAFFDGLIELAEGLKGFAEDAMAFIQTLIDAIDDIIEYLEELAANIITFLEFFTKGLPDAGIYLLPIKTTGGNKAIQQAITSSDDSPAEISPPLVYSAGIMLMGVENPATGQDPLVNFFENLLSIKFQAVGYEEPPKKSEEDKKAEAITIEFTMGDGTGTYSVGETVIEDTGKALAAGTEQITGVVVEWDATSKILKLSNISGTFAVPNNILGQESKTSYKIVSQSQASEASEK